MIDPADELICLRAGEEIAEHHGMVTPAITQASLFRRETMEELLRDLGRENTANVYSRGTNPTVSVLERTLAQLERGEACKCFASGMGAIGAVLFGLLKAGDHILFVNDIYGPTLELARRLSDFGVSHGQTFASDGPGIAEALLDETRIIFMESPGSTLFRLVDIPAITAIARERDILTVIDNTVSTPLLQKPIELGVDISLHSCSKYLGGHSDAIGGAVIGSSELVERIFYHAYMLMGAIMQPLEAWLFLRGLLTLPTRMIRHNSDTLALAEAMDRHDAVSTVYHPEYCPEDAELFAQQMRGHSGLFSIALADGGFDRALRVANRLEHFGKAVSWGGPESLVMMGHKHDPGKSSRVPAGLLRLSVGFEGANALIADIERALS